MSPQLIPTALSSGFPMGFGHISLYIPPILQPACLKTSLLRRLQAQALLDATQPIGKISPFGKMAVTFEPLMRFGCFS